MRSFAEYRKSDFGKKLPGLSIREGIDRHFDVLRLEILENVKLPPLLFEHSLVADSAYESARKGDYEDNKEMIEFLLNQCKTDFYADLISESGVADPSLDIDIEIKSLVQSLRDKITQLLGTTRPTGGSAPANSGASPNASAMGGSPASSGSHSLGSSPASSSPAMGGSPAHSGSPSPNNAGNASSVQPSPSRPVDRPEQPDGFKPAPYGSLRPADGFRAGFKRAVYDPIANWVGKKTQNFRRRWHKDEFRENFAFLEGVFLESHDAVMRVIDDFEKDLMSWVKKKLGTSVGGNPVAGTSVGASPMAGPTANVPVDVRGAMAGAANPAAGNVADADGLDDESSEDENEGETSIEDLPPEDQKRELVRGHQAVEGGKALGITVNVGKRGGTIGVRPSDVVDEQGQPIGSGWASIRNTISAKILDHISAQDNLRHNQLVAAAYGKEKTSRTTIRDAVKRIRAVEEWLGTKLPNGSKKSAMEMLVAFYQKKNGVPAAAQPDQTQGQPQEQPVASADSMRAAPSAPNASQNVEVNPRGAVQPAAQQPAVSGANSYSANIDEFMDKFRNEHGDILNKLLEKMPEDKVRSFITKKLESNMSPDDIANGIVNAAAKTSKASPAAAAATSPAAGPDATETPPAAGSDAAATSPADVGSGVSPADVPTSLDDPRVSAALEKMASKYGIDHQTFIDHGILSPDKILSAFSGADANDPDQMANKVAMMIADADADEGEGEPSSPDKAAEPQGQSPDQTKAEYDSLNSEMHKLFDTLDPALVDELINSGEIDPDKLDDENPNVDYIRQVVEKLRGLAPPSAQPEASPVAADQPVKNRGKDATVVPPPQESPLPSEESDEDADEREKLPVLDYDSAVDKLLNDPFFQKSAISHKKYLTDKGLSKQEVNASLDKMQDMFAKQLVAGKTMSSVSDAYRDWILEDLKSGNDGSEVRKESFSHILDRFRQLIKN